MNSKWATMGSISCRVLGLVVRERGGQRRTWSSWESGEGAREERREDRNELRVSWEGAEQASQGQAQAQAELAAVAELGYGERATPRIEISSS